MTEPSPEGGVKEQLARAVRDLWTMVEESGDDYVVFMDRRRMSTRVERVEDGTFRVSWDTEEGEWRVYHGWFDNPREAAFHAYQGPH
ncbi:MAG TPA: hypothetical protein VF221_01475 [Chloroflexota bacterium]